MPTVIDVRGQRFGHLLVLDADPVKRGRKYYWHCRCDCGQTSLVQSYPLRTGASQSCGCQRGLTIHGQHGTATYRTWNSMLQRCLNRKNPNYARYGGRGIAVCATWQASFAAFFADMGPRPGPGFSIERLDVNGPYEKNNCVWADRASQDNNTRRNIRVTWDGRTQTLSQWARERGFSLKTLDYRLRHWTVADAFTRPVNAQYRAKR